MTTLEMTAFSVQRHFREQAPEETDFAPERRFSPTWATYRATCSVPNGARLLPDDPVRVAGLDGWSGSGRVAGFIGPGLVEVLLDDDSILTRITKEAQPVR